MDKTRSYISWRNKSKLIDGRKHKKVCATLNYIEHFLILGSTITRYVSISAFASLVAIPKWITSSAIGLKTCTINAAIKKHKSIIKIKKKRLDNIVTKIWIRWHRSLNF